MMKNTAGPTKEMFVNMTGTTEFQEAKFHEEEFQLEMEKWQLDRTLYTRIIDECEFLSNKVINIHILN